LVRDRFVVPFLAAGAGDAPGLAPLCAPSGVVKTTASSAVFFLFRGGRFAVGMAGAAGKAAFC